MKLSASQVRHVAALARLELSDAEVESLGEDLSAILDYVEKLNELDTSDIEPTSHVVAMETPFREDRVTNPQEPERTLANAPKRENGHFVVPSIIE